MCRPQVERPLAALSLLHHQLQQRRQPWLAPDWSPPESVPDEAEAAAAWLRFQRRRVRLLTRRMRFLLLLLLALGVLQIVLGTYVSYCFHAAVAKHRARNQELQQALVRAGEAWQWQQQWWAQSKQDRAKGRAAHSSSSSSSSSKTGKGELGLPTVSLPARTLLALDPALDAVHMALDDEEEEMGSDARADDADGATANDTVQCIDGYLSAPAASSSAPAAAAAASTCSGAVAVSSAALLPAMCCDHQWLHHMPHSAHEGMPSHTQHSSSSGSSSSSSGGGSRSSTHQPISVHQP
ncbi:hypothetical protein CLOM_g16920 [Closterium sp. NIES-68]|nr:hypothetical protein CLOM_g16920 [Closterium sp. NIES-68]GJP65441.1 hypothetical protein CLOP_g22317 [Closterium sp. NIES-67]